MKKSTKRRNRTVKPVLKSYINKALVLLTSITTLLVGYFTIYDHIKPDSEPTPYEIVIENIAIIRNTFHPEMIPNELDSNICVKYYRLFQEEVLNTCTAWENAETSLSFEAPMEYKLSPNELLKNYNKRSNILIEHSANVIKNIAFLHFMADTLGYKDADIISITEFDILTELQHKKNSVIGIYTNRVQKRSYKNSIKKSVREIDKLRKDPDYLEFDIYFFNYCIEVQKNAEIMFKHNNIQLH